MPRLIKDGAVAIDSWTVIDDGPLPNEPAGLLLSPGDWAEHPHNALLLDVDTEPSADFVQAPMIAIRFPAMTDGRGLSLAVLLRTRFGYTGELRATGAVHPDLLHYMVRCGFDSFALPDEVDPAAALPLLQVHSGFYQASVVEPLPVFKRQVDRVAATG